MWDSKIPKDNTNGTSSCSGHPHSIYEDSGQLEVYRLFNSVNSSLRGDSSGTTLYSTAGDSAGRSSNLSNNTEESDTSNNTINLAASMDNLAGGSSRSSNVLQTNSDENATDSRLPVPTEDDPRTVHDSNDTAMLSCDERTESRYLKPGESNSSPNTPMNTISLSSTADSKSNIYIVLNSSGQLHQSTI